MMTPDDSPQRPSCRPRALSLTVPWAILLCVVAPANEIRGATPPAENVARGAEYRLFPSPNYRHCTDPGDVTQLTDGETTTDYFWTQKGAVGWQHAPYATVTVDLGRIEPISGVSLTTAAGVAGVTWPMAVHTLTSDDGKTWHDAGDLVALDEKVNGPWPGGYAIRRLVTNELEARGRFVQFVLIPLPGGPYMFCDEVEVYRGPKALLEREPAGPPVDAQTLFEQGRVERSVRLRFENDAGALAGLIRTTASLDETDRRQLLDELDEIRRQFRSEEITGNESFRAVLPIGREHARLFALQAKLWRAKGLPPVHVWVPNAWDPLDLITIPPKSASPMFSIRAMRNEARAAAVNLANCLDRPLTLRVRVKHPAGQPSRETVTVHEVQWTDTSQGRPVAAALPEAACDGDTWAVTVPPGMVRQVWLTFHTKDLPPEEYARIVQFEIDGKWVAKIVVFLTVWPVEFPEKPTLLVGGWSYTNGQGLYGVTAENRPAFLEHLQSRFVNAPWATSSVMRKYEFTGGDPPQVRIDTQEFDEWIARWPDAERYMVFLSVAHYSGSLRASFGGAEIGSEDFDRRVGAWISAWVRHLRSKGIAPNRLGLLIHDEPHEGSDIGPFLAWARAIRAAEPEVLIWEDPTYRKPAGAPAELFEACDVLCPNRPMWLAQGEPFAQFYLDQKRRGRELQFYSCSGPARLLDPYSYYRLQAWHCWHVGATGTFFWAFGDNSGSSSWNEYLTKAGPFTPLFLDDRSVTPGKQMEAIRESVQDYEYLVMLDKAVQKARAAGRSDAAVKQAEALIKTAARDVLAAEGADQIHWHQPKDRTKADAMRVEVAKAIVALEKSGQ